MVKLVLYLISLSVTLLNTLATHSIDRPYKSLPFFCNYEVIHKFLIRDMLFYCTSKGDGRFNTDIFISRDYFPYILEMVEIGEYILNNSLEIEGITLRKAAKLRSGCSGHIVNVATGAVSTGEEFLTIYCTDTSEINIGSFMIKSLREKSIYKKNRNDYILGKYEERRTLINSSNFKIHKKLRKSDPYIPYICTQEIFIVNNASKIVFYCTSWTNSAIFMTNLSLTSNFSPIVGKSQIVGVLEDKANKKEASVFTLKAQCKGRIIHLLSGKLQKGVGFIMYYCTDIKDQGLEGLIINQISNNKTANTTSSYIRTSRLHNNIKAEKSLINMGSEQKDNRNFYEYSIHECNYNSVRTRDYPQTIFFCVATNSPGIFMSDWSNSIDLVARKAVLGQYKLPKVLFGNYIIYAGCDGIIIHISNGDIVEGGKFIVVLCTNTELNISSSSVKKSMQTEKFFRMSKVIHKKNNETSIQTNRNTSTYKKSLYECTYQVLSTGRYLERFHFCKSLTCKGQFNSELIINDTLAPVISNGELIGQFMHGSNPEGVEIKSTCYGRVIYSLMGQLRKDEEFLVIYCLDTTNSISVGNITGKSILDFTGSELFAKHKSVNLFRNLPYKCLYDIIYKERNSDLIYYCISLLPGQDFQANKVKSSQFSEVFESEFIGVFSSYNILAGCSGRIINLLSGEISAGEEFLLILCTDTHENSLSTFFADTIASVELHEGRDFTHSSPFMHLLKRTNNQSNIAESGEIVRSLPGNQIKSSDLSSNFQSED
ncbi:hypothetical protein ACR3K2_14760 [Cryptosporidium serpentis]